MADDDLFGFFNELKEVKPPAEEEAGGGGGGGKDEGVQHIGPANPPGGTGKRAREEEEAEHNPNVANEIGPAMPPAHHPAFKKAKAVAAKPLLYDTPSIGPVEPPPQYQQQQQQAFAPPTSISAAPTKSMLAYDEQPPPSSTFPPSAPAPYQPYMAPYLSAAAATTTAAAAPPPQISGAGVGTLFTVGAGAKPAVGGGGGGRTGQQPAFGAARAASEAVGGGKPKKFIRVGPGETWEDPTLIEWPENDFRLFCGDLGPEVNDELLAKAFEGKYPSFAKSKVLREKQTGKSRGYGFVSFLDPFEGLKALREMNGRYIGSRPVKLKKCDWKERDLKEVRKKEKAKKKFLGKLGLG